MQDIATGLEYRNSSIKTVGGSYLFQTHLSGANIEMGEGNGSSSPQRTRIQWETSSSEIKYKKSKVMQPRITKPVRTSSW